MKPQTRELLFTLIAIILVVGCYILSAYLDNVSAESLRLLGLT